jgi:Flp pilus assembly pilin Flp
LLWEHRRTSVAFTGFQMPEERSGSMNLLKKFVRDEAGMETVEWAIMSALIVAGVIAIVAGIGTNVNNAFTKLQTGTTPP